MKKKKVIHCFPKLKDEVIIPDRKDLLLILNELKKPFINQVLTIEEFVDELGGFIGKKFKVDVTHAETPEVEANDVDFNGFYDSGLDENEDPPIEIYIITNSYDSFLILDEEGFEIIMRRLADSIIHELIHMKQSRARDFLEVDDMAYATDTDDEIEEAQLYLGTPDEIDAYAYNIACELLDTGDLVSSLKRLEKPTQIKIEDSQNLWAYIHAFSDVNHPVMKRLIKRIYKSLHTLGK